MKSKKAYNAYVVIEKDSGFSFGVMPTRAAARDFKRELEDEFHPTKVKLQIIRTEGNTVVR